MTSIIPHHFYSLEKDLRSSESIKAAIIKKTRATIGVNESVNLSIWIAFVVIPSKGLTNISLVFIIQPTMVFWVFALIIESTIRVITNASISIVAVYTSLINSFNMVIDYQDYLHNSQVLS